jgi:general secretion pathway protein K
MEDGEIRGAIVDAQGRLNVNALGLAGESAPERARFAALFTQRGAAHDVLGPIADWIDDDRAVRDAGAEDAFYLAQPVPHLAANGPVLRVAELAVVKAMTSRGLASVLPFLSALPPGTPVNVNTAPPEVLAAIADNLAGERLESLVADRARKPFTTVAEFRARLPEGAKLASDIGLSVNSSYYYVTMEARQGANRARARALVRRSGGAASAIVWQVLE